MTQEEKDLLLKDLCARLPYGVKCYGCQIKIDGNDIECYGTLKGISNNDFGWKFTLNDRVSLNGRKCYDESYSEVKPYLFPLSSMTEEQKKELYGKLIELKLKAINDKISRIEAVKFEVDFYNKHHLDWRGFIPKNLAIDCTNLNIY